MAVTLTSPALGLDVGDTYTGDEEAWLLAEGYAKRVGYTGPGVANTGPAAEAVADDLTLAANREDPPGWDEDNHVVDPGPLDPAMTFSTSDDDPNDPPRDPAYDFDQGGVNDDKPTFGSLEFAEGTTSFAAAGGTPVTIHGQNLTGLTGVQFEGATAFTSVVVEDDETATAVSPAKAAGTYDLLLVNANGTTTVTDGAVVA